MGIAELATFGLCGLPLATSALDLGGKEDTMAMEVEKLFGTAVTELERMLNSKTVVGDPITVEGSTIIPLVSVGFGFGVGGGEGQGAAPR